MTNLRRCKVVFNTDEDFVNRLKETKNTLSKVFDRGEIEPTILGEREYTFATDIQDLKRGDRVVVNARNEYQVVTFVKYTSEVVPEGTKMKYVIDKVNFDSFYARIEKEARLRELREKMEQRRKGLEEITIFKMLAEEDEEMKKMLEEYQDLTK